MAASWFIRQIAVIIIGSFLLMEGTGNILLEDGSKIVLEA